MYLVRTMPLVRLPPTAPPVLDYFWPQPLAAGAVVRIPMGQRTVPAVVRETRDVRSAKASLKQADFELKRLTAVIADAPQLTAGQMAVADWITTQYYCSPAVALRTVAPPFIGKPRGRLDHPLRPTMRDAEPVVGSVHVTQPDTARDLIRMTAAGASRQVLVLVPEQRILESLRGTLPDDTVIVTGGMPAARFREAYRRVMDGSARIVLGTRTALFLPWADLGDIIVEDPLNDLYKNDGAPRYHAADVARHLATLCGANLTWLTPALSSVQFHLRTTGVMPVIDEKPWWPDVTVTTARSEIEAGESSRYSRSARNAVLTAFERRDPVLIYSARRAYATIARCVRCRGPALCPTCDIPMRWHRTSEDMLVCYHCAAYTAVPTSCPLCQAGVLRPAGAPGSQKLAESLAGILDRAGYPAVRIPILDSDLVRDRADSARQLTQFREMPHPILVATSMVFGYRYDLSFDTIIVPSADMLMTNPDFRTTDRLIVQLEKLADFHPRRLIIQTLDDEHAFTDVGGRDWESRYRTELIHRKALCWPPYARVIKVSVSHRDRATSSRLAAAGADRLTRTAAHLKLSGVRILGPAPALVEHGGGTWTQHLIIKHSLTSRRIAELLHHLPPGWTVDVDPRSIA